MKINSLIVPNSQIIFNIKNNKTTDKFCGNNFASELHNNSNCTFGMSLVNYELQNAKNILEEILSGTNKDTGRINLSRDVIYAEITEEKEIDGWGKFPENVANATFYKDNTGKLDKIYIQDAATRETKIYSAEKELEKAYTKEDMQALFYYKYHPDSIHKLLREDREIYSGSWIEETKDSINGLENIFSNPNKLEKTNETIKLYRAMDADFKKIKAIGQVYEDNSFCSTTTDINVARRFKSQSAPILEIEFEKGSSYIDMDKLFNFKYKKWNEDEFLLNKNSKFLITGYDSENDVIKAKYMP